MAGNNPNDWLCPNAGCINAVKGVFAKHSSCPKCGSFKSIGYGPALGMPMNGVGAGGGGGGGGGSRAGDWLCPNPDCINAKRGVFGKHESCPQCGSLKDSGMPVPTTSPRSSDSGPPKSDWMCPNPSCMNNTKGVFGRHDQCPKCGSNRAEGLPAPERVGGKSKTNAVDNAAADVLGKLSKFVQGWTSQSGSSWGTPSTAWSPYADTKSGPTAKVEDWMCPNMSCVNSTKGVFGRHVACPKCGCCKPGDWACPNAQCVNHYKLVFSRHVLCPKCNTAKPGTPAAHQQQLEQLQQMARDTMGIDMGIDMGGGKLGGGFMGGGKGGSGSNRMAFGQKGGSPEDWRCPEISCINNRRMVFGKHPNCPQCGAEKPDKPVKGGKGGGRSGDWQCPNTECKNHNNFVFAKHETCPSCGTAKLFDEMSFGEAPSAATDASNGARDRSRSPHATYS